MFLEYTATNKLRVCCLNLHERRGCCIQPKQNSERKEPEKEQDRERETERQTERRDQSTKGSVCARFSVRLAADPAGGCKVRFQSGLLAPYGISCNWSCSTFSCGSTQLSVCSELHIHWMGARDRLAGRGYFLNGEKWKGCVGGGGGGGWGWGGGGGA